MRIFLNKWFVRFARREQINNKLLIDAVDRANQGLIDADLGGGLIKQRIARPGKGRSGGYRAIIVLKVGERAYLIYGFAKSDRENLDPDELLGYKRVAGDFLNLTDSRFAELVAESELVEITADDETA